MERFKETFCTRETRKKMVHEEEELGGGHLALGIRPFSSRPCSTNEIANSQLCKKGLQ